MILTRYRRRRDARIRAVTLAVITEQARRDAAAIRAQVDALNSRAAVITANGSTIARIVAQQHYDR